MARRDGAGVGGGGDEKDGAGEVDQPAGADQPAGVEQRVGADPPAGADAAPDGIGRPAPGRGRAAARLRALTDGGGDGKFGDLGTRLATAAVLTPLALGMLWLGGAAVAVLLTLLAAILAAEWRSVTAHGGGMLQDTDPVVVAAAPMALFTAHVFTPFIGLSTLAVVAGVGLLLDWRRGWYARGLWALLGTLLIGVGTIAFLWLRDTDPFGPLAALWIVLVVVAADVGGYFAGRLIGGPKLWPSVSPKKTWAGLGGAVLLATLAGWLFSGATTGTFFEEVCTVSAAAALMATFGDMGESAVKRHFGVKDSGTLLPGHGGAMDRFDGLLAATLVVAAVTLWRGQTVFIWS
ncbi:MAG: phosphatidate cytidylyltransferase [Pseudomonadota bacterium]